MPRSKNNLDDASRLQALADGYFGLTPVFLGTLIAGYPLQLLLIGGFNGAAGLLIGTILVTTATVAGFTLRPLRRLGFGSGWPPAFPSLVALTLGLTAPLFCGMISFPIVLGAAMRRMRKLGVPIRFLGPKREDVYARCRILSGPNPFL